MGFTSCISQEERWFYPFLCRPLPRIDETLEQLSNKQFFSALDLASGYWQIPVHDKDREKTAFISKYGLYEFNAMPFGLTNAPATFQRTMDLVLDDIIIYSSTFDQHLKDINEVLTVISNSKLKLKLLRPYNIKQWNRSRSI